MRVRLIGFRLDVHLLIISPLNKDGSKASQYTAL